MRTNAEPHASSYEAALTEEQRISFHAMLLSGITLAEAREQALPWPAGPEKDNKPSPACLGRIRLRLKIEEKVLRIEEAKATMRATQKLLKPLVTKTDQEQVLDEAMTLIGQQVIEASLDLGGLSSKTAAAWLLMRRADQRRSDRRIAIFEAQAGRDNKTGKNPPLPPMDNVEKK